MTKPDYRKQYEESGTIDLQWIQDSISYQPAEEPIEIPEEKRQEILEWARKSMIDQMHRELELMEENERYINETRRT